MSFFIRKFTFITNIHVTTLFYDSFPVLLNDFLQFNDFSISYIKVISPKIKI